MIEGRMAAELGGQDAVKILLAKEAGGQKVELEIEGPADAVAKGLAILTIRTAELCQLPAQSVALEVMGHIVRMCDVLREELQEG